MFDIGWGEMIVIGIVALIAIGPKELPTVLRTIGQWTGKLRRMAGEFQGQFQEAIRESEIADLKKQFDDAANSVNSYTSSATNFDPLAKTRQEVESAFDFASDASTKPAAAEGSPSAAVESPPVDTQLPSEVSVPPTSEAVSLPPPDAPVPPPPDTIEVAIPEPAPLDPALTPASSAPPPAAEPSAPHLAAQPPKESGA